ncbi:MAG: hypothetical protein AB8B56_18670, partial [Crocinitomicaceae bacterium]
ASATGAPEKRTIYEIATYDLSDVHQSLDQVRSIDFLRRRWRTEITKEEKGSYYEETRVHRVKHEVVKVVFDKVFAEGIVRTEYYLTDETTFYIKQHTGLIRNGQNDSSGCELFIESDGKIIRHNLSEPGKWVDCDSYHECLKRLEKILDE